MKDSQMVSFHDCLNTFVDWKGPNAIHMAASGFFYKGPGDLVQCYECGLKLKKWKQFHSPYYEHDQWSKSFPCVVECAKNRLWQETESTVSGHESAPSCMGMIDRISES